MASKPRTVRNVQYRTLGSGTRLRDEIKMPVWLYHGGRASRWCVRNWRVSLAVLAVWVLGLAFSLPVALVVVGAVYGVLGMLRFSRSRHSASLSEDLARLLEERKYRNTLEKQWPLACETARLLSPRTDEPPRLTRLNATRQGTLEATVIAGKIGVTIPAIAKQVITLSEVIGCKEVVVTPTGPGVCHIAFHWLDPIERGISLAEVPLTSAGNLAYGIRQDGSVATVKSNLSMLIGGLTGKGKSNLIWALLADAIRQGVHIDLYVSDPKGGVELDAFEAALDAGSKGVIRVVQYAKSAEETVTMLANVEKAMHTRQEWMKQNGVRKIVPSADNPLVVTILDETLPLTDLLKKGTASPLGRVAYTGRAAGYVVWANTQVAQVDSLGRFRDLIPQRLCFATPNSFVTDSVLGDGSESAGAKCSELREPGVGYSYSEGHHTPRKFRAAEVKDAETRLIAQGKLPADVAQSVEHMQGESRGDFALYRHYNSEGVLLYVGKTNHYLRRSDEHADTKDWWKQIDTTKVQWFTSEKECLDAERVAILTEKPLYNDQHNHGNPRRRVDKRKTVDILGRKRAA